MDNIDPPHIAKRLRRPLGDVRHKGPVEPSTGGQSAFIAAMAVWLCFDGKVFTPVSNIAKIFAANSGLIAPNAVLEDDDSPAAS
ncbi:hypothetical protein [Rhodoblastus sp.]|uniref:hypothetical protein n=1 Tax=Rhodoblastus sp. TaxID=1962975 RepID=UPI0025D18784|nr:hypothetical protein [Rhodoblastus sp.]